ncbi:MAG TPA: FAD/NAD(P)-binding protein [bacterium]
MRAKTKTNGRGADPMRPDLFLIKRVRKETADTFTMELQPQPGSRVRPFRPGQFNMLDVIGVGEVPISISGDPASTVRVGHTTRAVGAVTNAMSRLGRGGLLGVRGPFGTGWPLDLAAGRDVVIVAGGIGLAPLRPAIYHVLAHRSRYGRVVLLYGTRTPSDILFRNELRLWGGRFDLDVQVTVDRGEGGWRGNVGVVTPLIRRAGFDPLQALAMVCGPEIMMRFAVQELQKRGVTNDRIYVSLERNMKCAIGLCGHCQFGPFFVCKDGPVFRVDRVEPWLAKREI